MTAPFAYCAVPLIAALTEYDRTAPERAAAWDAIESQADIEAAQATDKVALLPVQDAFYELTKDRNSLADCRCCDIKFMRSVAKLATNSSGEKPA